MLPALGIAGSLLGGGGGGGGMSGPSSSAKGSQDGNALSSGGGGFKVGGGAPDWLWPVVIGAVAIVGLLMWKPWKRSG
jgi:hypothetical protein